MSHEVAADAIASQNGALIGWCSHAPGRGLSFVSIQSSALSTPSSVLSPQHSVLSPSDLT